ncbi:MAG: hypothetical protein ABEK50_06115 [bacterium]
MSESGPGGSESVEYDRDKLADDPEYREKILQDIAENSSTLSTAVVTRWLLYMIMGLLLFVAGVFIGGKLGERYAFYFSLSLACFVILPTLIYLIYYRQQHQ